MGKRRVAAACAATVFMTCSSLADLTTTYQLDGHVGGELAAYAVPVSQTCSGDLTLSTIPVGATIERAYLYTNGWHNYGPVSASFAGTTLPPADVYASDGAVRTYRWEVTGLVGGNGTYEGAITDSPGETCYGMMLAVAYGHPELPVGRVLINDGAAELAENYAYDTETTYFDAVAGPSKLYIHTEADDSQVGGEQILFNGEQVGGPINQNLGPPASLFAIDVTAMDGVNDVTITTPFDRFGWHVALLTTVPEPSSVFLMGAVLALVTRVRKGD